MEKARLFLPPFEWYNREIVNWSRELGLEVVNFTPGTGTNADYTSPGMENYRSSEEILAGLESFARNSGSGLNGAILLIHPGTPEERVDKLYQRLGGLIDSYLDRGYRFGSLDLAEE